MSRLPLGEYSVKECLAPENFILSDTVEDVSLTYKDQNTSIVFDNASFTNERQKVEINVYKIDKDDERLLANAEFSLYAKNDITNYKGEVIMKANDLIEIATSDEKGKATFKSDLPFSQFLLKETKAPKGYIASDEIITIDAKYKLFKDKLSTQKIYEINFNELKLAEDEYVTEYEFRFGKVKVGFREVESPILYCNMLDGLGNGFVFTNHTKVSGTYYDVYVEDTDDWTTITYFKEIKLEEKLPRTGGTDYSSFIATGIIMLINGIGIALTLREKKEQEY